MPHMLYVIGQPGAGKTTLMNALKEGKAGYVVAKPFAHTYYDTPAGQVVELGKKKGTFSGTDTLAMSVLPKVLTQMEWDPWPLVIGEGDRLATDKFFGPVRSFGYDVTVVYLDTPDGVAATWRAARAGNEGSTQDAAWVRGRITKHRNLAEKVSAVTITEVDLDDRLAALRALGNPVVEALSS